MSAPWRMLWMSRHWITWHIYFFFYISPLIESSRPWTGAWSGRFRFSSLPFSNWPNSTRFKFYLLWNWQVQIHTHQKKKKDWFTKLIRSRSKTVDLFFSLGNGDPKTLMWMCARFRSRVSAEIEIGSKETTMSGLHKARVPAANNNNNTNDIMEIEGYVEKEWICGDQIISNKSQTHCHLFHYRRRGLE